MAGAAIWEVIMLEPAYIQQLIGIAEAAAAAGHGNKESIYQRACLQLGKNRATLLRHLKQVTVSAPRKRRSDAGVVTMSRQEAALLSAYLMEGYRKNNRKITSLKEAVQVLRDNKVIDAVTIDHATGEIVPLSESAISRALRAHVLHPDQLRQATPHTRLQSLYPNHVWEVDASVCVIYYLPDGGAELVELDQAVHYKNKPQNLKAIEQFRVIRYVLADHASGTIRYRYYPHSESGEHTVRFLAWAMARKSENDPFHGAPTMVMVDPGATAGGLVQRFCARMNIELIINKRKNARAKGSVEKANHLVETSFEQALRYLKPRPSNFDELNALSETYQLWWNATKIHTRTNRTRLEVWLTITAEQLRITPDADVLLQLATQEPIKRTVQGDLTVSFKNRRWNVEDVPGVTVKGDVYVHWHPFIADTAMAVIWGDDGREQHIALPEIKFNALGFDDNAVVIGEKYEARADTIADTNRKRIHQIAAGTDTLRDTDKKRESKHYTPFDGQIDPLLASKQALPAFLPKRGTALDIAVPTVELLRMNAVQMAKWLRGRLGAEYQQSMLADLQKRYPEGASEPELEQVLADINAGRNTDGRARLRAV
jgi:urease gamma subunit